MLLENLILATTKNDSDIATLAICVCGASLIGFVLLIGYRITLGYNDKNKPIEVQTVKIIEKTITNNNIEWLIAENEKKERIKLRNLKADTILITIGDIGKVEYQGQTICSFQKEN